MRVPPASKVTASNFKRLTAWSAKVVDQKGVAIGRFLDQLGGRLARAVAGLGLDADQDGVVAGLGGLQRRGELEAVRRDDAVVVVGRGDQRRPGSACRA